MAELLIEREVIFAEDAERIFGKRPWTSRAQEIIDANAAEAEVYAKAVAEARAAREEKEKKEKENKASGTQNDGNDNANPSGDHYNKDANA